MNGARWLTNPNEDVYTCYMLKTETKSEARRPFPLLPCTCSNLRRASRVVTRLYNRALQSDGIEITQFTLLMALDQVGEISQGELGEILALDSTSLTRMLKLLKDHGWVQAKEGEDRRMQIFRLTKAGREKFQQSLRHWKQAQEQLRTALGAKNTGELSALLAEITRVSQEA